MAIFLEMDTLRICFTNLEVSLNPSKVPIKINHRKQTAGTYCWHRESSDVTESPALIDNSVLMWWLSNMRRCQILLEGLLEHAFLGSSLIDSESVSLECGLRICISDKSPGCDNVAGLGLRLGESELCIISVAVSSSNSLITGAHILRATVMCQAWC